MSSLRANGKLHRHLGSMHMNGPPSSGMIGNTSPISEPTTTFPLLQVSPNTFSDPR